jgi:hypothetical protein
MAVMFQVDFFSVLTPFSVVLGYRRFRDPYCLHLLRPEDGFRMDPRLKFMWLFSELCFVYFDNDCKNGTGGKMGGALSFTTRFIFRLVHIFMALCVCVCVCARVSVCILLRQ